MGAYITVKRKSRTIIVVLEGLDVQCDNLGLRRRDVWTLCWVSMQLITSLTSVAMLITMVTKGPNYIVCRAKVTRIRTLYPTKPEALKVELIICYVSSCFTKLKKRVH